MISLREDFPESDSHQNLNDSHTVYDGAKNILSYLQVRFGHKREMWEAKFTFF